MAKVTLAPEFESMSGKLCSRSKTCIALNKKTGKMVRYDVHQACNPNTAKQQAQRTADYKRLKDAFDAQNRIGNIYGYLCSCVQKDGTIVISGVPVTNFVPDTDGLG